MMQIPPHSKTCPAKNATSLAVRYSGCLLTPDYNNWGCPKRLIEMEKICYRLISLKRLVLYPKHFCLVNHFFGTGAHCWRANHLTSRARDESTGEWDICCWDYFLRSQVCSLTSKHALWVNYGSKYIDRGDIASENLSVNQPFSILGLTSQARLLLMKTMMTSRIFCKVPPSLPPDSP